LRLLTNDVPETGGCLRRLLKKAADGEFQFCDQSAGDRRDRLTLESYYPAAEKPHPGANPGHPEYPGLDVADSDLVLQAIHGYVERTVDFIDAFNAA